MATGDYGLKPAAGPLRGGLGSETSELGHVQRCCRTSDVLACNMKPRKDGSPRRTGQAIQKAGITENGSAK